MIERLRVFFTDKMEEIESDDYDRIGWVEDYLEDNHIDGNVNEYVLKHLIDLTYSNLELPDPNSESEIEALLGWYIKGTVSDNEIRPILRDIKINLFLNEG